MGDGSSVHQIIYDNTIKSAMSEPMDDMRKCFEPDIPTMDLLMDLCFMEDGNSLQLNNDDLIEAEKLIQSGIILKKGRWASLTDKGKRLRDKICH